jgi:hypothetical protein
MNALCEDRLRLLKQLARVVDRAGPNHPERASENAKRSRERKRVRRALKDNASSIVAGVMQDYEHRTSRRTIS